MASFDAELLHKTGSSDSRLESNMIVLSASQLKLWCIVRQVCLCHFAMGACNPDTANYHLIRNRTSAELASDFQGCNLETVRIELSINQLEVS
jgi:hypothetical protein